MNDRLLVCNFIEKNFILLTSNTSFHFKEKLTLRELEYGPFYDFLYKIFGPINGEFGTLWDIFRQWFEEKKRILFAKLNNYLKECTVALSTSNWVVVHNKKEVTSNRLKNLFADDYHASLIEYYFERWYELAVIKASEKLMNSNILI